MARLASGRSMGRRFGWLWAAYAASTAGTWFAFNAFPLIAIRVLHSGAAQVSLLSAAGRAVGALVAIPLGPWVEFHRKRPVMIAMDALRFAVLLSLPVAYGLGVLSFAQLVAVSVIVAAANVVFTAAGGAHLKALVQPEDLLRANGRFESTTWTATVVAPPLGGIAVALLGPVATVVADAVSYLLSALGIRAIGGGEPRPPAAAGRIGLGEILDGWRYILRDAALRPWFVNRVFVNGLIMATEPLLAVMLLRDLGFAPWEYALAFAVPCAGGLVGARLARPLVARFGQHRVMLVAASLRVIWPVGLAFVGPGAPGVLLVMADQFGLILCIGVFNPVIATYRLEHTPAEFVARTLTAWTISSTAAIALLTVGWGVLAELTSPRGAIAVAGVLLLFTPLALRRAPR